VLFSKKGLIKTQNVEKIIWEVLFMTKTQAFETLYGKIEANRAIEMAESIIHWDALTSGVPVLSLPARGAAAGWLSGEAFRRFIAPDTLEAIETLESFGSELSFLESAMVRELGRKYRKAKAIPSEALQAFSALIAQSQSVWETAREKRDYEMILPYYEKIFDYQRRLCDWYGYEKHPYDALLDDFEPGVGVDILEGFFAALRAEIVPLLGSIMDKGDRPEEVVGSFDVDKQKELLPWLTGFIGYDRSRGKIGEVEHPFCTTITRHDVRITTKYHEDSLMSAMYSTLHESGHAIYEQNIDEGLEQYGLANGSSMGMHESQSRLYENMICRSRAFAGVLLPKLQGLFDFFAKWDEGKLFRAVNITRPSLIRIEADELTYSLHIMVRYELEKALMTGEIKAADLPGLWDDKYEELLGVRPNNMAEGVLQDVHWSGGTIGYFPSYAIGTAYGAQWMNEIKKTVDVDAAIKSQDLSPVSGWLKENMYKHGMSMTPGELLLKATGEPFNVKYYIDYLKEKFTGLYL